MKGQLIQEKYQILKILTHNVFCETFLARDKSWLSGRRYIIKKIRPILGNPQVEAMRRTFYQEASVLKRLSGSNPQIPRLYEYFMDGEDFYLVREWIDGLTLEQKVKRAGKLSAIEVEDILRSVLSFLEYIHSYNIIYRQLKPNTIVLRQKRWSLDPSTRYLPIPIYFGGVKELEQAMQHHIKYSSRSHINTWNYSKPNLNLPTELQFAPKLGSNQKKRWFSRDRTNKSDLTVLQHQQYIPPEQQQGRSVFASDLYSLGLTAIYLLTGKNPDEFPVDPRTNQPLWHQEAAPLKINLARAIDRAICPQIERRYTSATEMLAALDSQTVNLSLLATSPATSKTRFSPELKIFAFLSAAGIGVLGLTFLLLNLDLSRSPNDEIEPALGALSVDTLPASLEPSLTDKQPEMGKVPTFPLGMTQQSIVNLLGEPTMNSRGYWQNSRALLYSDIVPQKIALGYLTDTETTNIRQAEIAFANSVNLLTVKQEAQRLLQHSYSPEVDHYINQVYFRTSDRHYFATSSVEGVVQRNPQEHIYIAIWERGFHD